MWATIPTEVGHLELLDLLLSFSGVAGQLELSVAPTHGVAGKQDLVGTVARSIQNGIRQCSGRQRFVPLFNQTLAGGHRGPHGAPSIERFW